MRLFVFATLATILAAPACANDTIGALETGGLVLKTTTDIEMRSEYLRIGIDKIAVRYVFGNIRDHDVTTTVAFPVPDETTQYYSPTAIPEGKTDYLLDFRTTVDGKPVKVETEQKVFVDIANDNLRNDTDYAPMLRQLGIPLRLNAEATTAAIARLSPDDLRKLADLNLIMKVDDGSETQKPSYVAAWRLRTTYYWEQTFPAGKELKVEHEYTPALGGMSSFSLFKDTANRNEEYYQGFVKEYCIDRSFEKAAEAIPENRNGTDIQIIANNVAYVLKTGANWAAPIRDFRLVIEKDKPDTLVSLCGDGIRKISPTEFEMRKKDFLPTEDLRILFLRQVPVE